MASKYWIKLYHEIIDDPKMGKLSDALWRRCIELFLIAGEYDSGGQLPSLDNIAWKLRSNAELLEAELNDLARVGITNLVNGTWEITKFEERQARPYSMEPAAVRQRAYRAKIKEEEKITEKDTDIDIDTEMSRYMSRDIMSQNNKLPHLPSIIASPALMTKWGEWCQYQQDKGHPLVYRTAKVQQDSFTEWGEARSIAAMDFSMAQGYKGLVDPVGNSNQRLTPLDHSKAAIKRALGD